MGAYRRTRSLWTTTWALLAVACTARPAWATDPLPPAAVMTSAPTPQQAPATEPDPELARSGSPKTLGLTLGGAGVVGLGVGTIFGLLSISAWSSTTGGCGPAGNVAHCVAKNPAQVTSDHDSAQTDSSISTVAFILGGVLVVAGGAVLLTGTHRGGGEAPAFALTPAVGPGQAGFAMSGSF